MNYFRFGNSTKIFQGIDSYVHERLALWWSKKHRRSGRRWKTDLTWEEFKDSGIVIMTGNIIYWSEFSNA